MDEYISREAIVKEIKEEIKACDAKFVEDIQIKKGLKIAIRDIKAAKTADVQPTKWINAKDRLPDESCECLGVVDGEVTEVSYDPKQKGLICVWSMCDADGFRPLSDDAVTHWMPLPEPPKDGETNG
jgi:hypothetical protein